MANEGALRQRSNRSSDESNERPPSPSSDELRLVLLGRTGAGKSATGNTILGEDRFNAELSMNSVTKECKRAHGTVEERELLVVDTPDFIDSDQTLKERKRCLSLCSPGPHVFLLVIPIDRYTEEQQRTVQMILEMFNEDISNHSILIFSHADRLKGESIEEFISRQNPKVQELVERFGRRFVAFDNTNPTNREQVSRLLQKVNQLVENDNCHLTIDVKQVIQEAQRIMEEKREADMAERKKNVKKQVRKAADVRWRAFISYMNEERQETERRRKRIERRIDQIQTDIMKEEQNEPPIPERLRRFTASLQTELENMGRLEERRMEEERERKEREEREQQDLKIWVQEEEQRRLSEAKQNNPLSLEYNKMIPWILVVMLGIVIICLCLVISQQSGCKQEKSWGLFGMAA